MATITTADHPQTTVPGLRQIPLSRIVVPDGFNPRGAVRDDRELEQLAESMRRHGCLQPIRVRATEQGDYVLIAGERRYRAAVKAALMELPAIVRAADLGDEEEESALLVEAVLENDQRVDLDPVARARGYRRLLDAGLTIKGVAEQLATTQARVREHLRILQLPDEAQARIAGGEIPLRAVKALEQLARVHSGLVAAAIGEVLNATEDAYGEEYTWADVEKNPLEVALHAGELPEGVYQAHAEHPIEAFELSKEAQKDLAALEKLIGVPMRKVRFGAEELEQARALGAAHGENWQAIIVGAEVASQLAGDYIARCLKVQRENERRRAKLQRDHTAGDTERPPGERGPEAEQEARRAERKAELQARENATRFNAELGRGIYTGLARVKVDERTLRLLASVDVTGELGEIAMRGARYGFPGWVEEQTQKNGKAKLAYIEQRAEAERRASEYLAGAGTAGEIAGRQLALVAMAVYADQHAVAQSNRCWHETKPVGPWAGEFEELLDELVRDKLPPAAIALLEPVLAKRQQRREQQAAGRRAEQEALERLDGVEQRIGELDDEQLAQAEEDLAAGGLRWSQRGVQIRQLIKNRRAELAGSGESQAD